MSKHPLVAVIDTVPLLLKYPVTIINTSSLANYLMLFFDIILLLLQQLFIIFIDLILKVLVYFHHHCQIIIFLQIYPFQHLISLQLSRNRTIFHLQLFHSLYELLLYRLIIIIFFADLFF